MEPPQILRIKRKRGQDPLQALILGDLQAAKRSKPSSPRANAVPQPLEVRSYYFHLAETDDRVTDSDSNVLSSVLSESSLKGSNKRKRQFVIPRQNEEEDKIPHELAEMLDDLKVDDPPRSRKRRGRKNKELAESWGNSTPEFGQDSQGIGHSNQSGNESSKNSAQSSQSLNQNSGETGVIQDSKSIGAEADADEYVFDVYKLSTADVLTNANYPLSQIGYIRFYDDEEFGMLQLDDENGSPTAVHSEDEDSNAESFYQNDYPEDEDAGTYSDSYEYDTDNYGAIIVDSAESAEAQAYLSGHVQADMAEPQHYDDLYDDFFDQDGNQVADLVPSDDDFQRQNFFADEEDDALAIHRDRIFGRLQKMIHEK